MSLAALERRLALAARGLRPGATGTAPPSALALAEALGLDLDPWQRDVLASEATQTAMLCSRQSGKSTVAALLAAWQALAVPGCLVLLLAPSERQAKLLLRSVRRFAAAVPDAARPTNDGRQSLELSNGSEVVALPASEETIRGYAAVALLVVDEAAAVDDALYASMRPTLAVSGGRIVLLSTPRGKRGFFYREWVEGGDDWLRVKVTAADCPRIPADWLARERARIGPWWAAQEYDVEFREAVDQVFGHDVVLAALSDEVAPLFGGSHG